MVGAGGSIGGLMWNVRDDPGLLELADMYRRLAASSMTPEAVGTYLKLAERYEAAAREPSTIEAGRAMAFRWG